MHRKKVMVSPKKYVGPKKITKKYLYFHWSILLSTNQKEEREMHIFFFFLLPSFLLFLLFLLLESKIVQVNLSDVIHIFIFISLLLYYIICFPSFLSFLLLQQLWGMTRKNAAENGWTPEMEWILYLYFFVLENKMEMAIVVHSL